MFNKKLLSLNVLLYYKLLGEREASILIRRYSDGLTLAEIGKEYNISATRVKQIIQKALRKLKHPSRLRILQDLGLI